MAQISVNVVPPSQSGAITALPVLGAQSLLPVQAVISAAVTMPSIGGGATISLSPMTSLDGTAISPSAVFLAGDLIQLSQYDAAGSTVREAYFSVTSVAGNVVTAQLLNRSGNTFVATTGDVFPVGSELTGQTRLTAPVGATKGEIYVNDNLAFRIALVDTTNPRNRVASVIAQRFPLLQVSTSGNVDPINSPGIPLTTFGEYALETAADITAVRIFCSTLFQFRPTLSIVYR